MSQQSVIRKIAFREFLNISLGASVLCIILYLASGHRAIISIIGIKAISWAGIIGYFMYFRANYATGIRNAGFRLRKIILLSVLFDLMVLTVILILCYLVYVKA